MLVPDSGQPAAIGDSTTPAVRSADQAGLSLSEILGAASAFTLEHALYLAILGAAAVMRLAALGNTPLAPSEAGEALAVWNFWQPDSSPVSPSSPAYFSFTALLTQVIGFSDATVRLVPALAGLLLVLSPWLYRPYIGRRGALTAAFLLAISPTHSFAARTAGGDSLALAVGALLLVSWLNYHRLGEGRWLAASAVFLGVGLASSPLFLTMLFAVLLAWAAQALIGPALFEQPDGSASAFIRPERELGGRAAQWGIAALLLLGTAFFWNLGGLGNMAGIWGDWLAQFSVPVGFAELMAPVLALFRYELILFTIGVAATIWAAWTGRAWSLFLVYWQIGALTIVLLQHTQVTNSLVLSFPTYLLLGLLLDGAFKRPGSWYVWPASAGLIFAGFVGYFNLVRLSRLAAATDSSGPLSALLVLPFVAGAIYALRRLLRSNFGRVPGTAALLITGVALYFVLRSAVGLASVEGGSSDQPYYLMILLLALAAALAFLLLLWNWDQQLAVRGGLIGALVMLSAYSWGTGWWVNVRAANDTREPWIRVASDDDLRLLADTARDVSMQVTNSENDLEIVSIVDSPAVAWYLREFGRLELAGSVAGSSGAQAVIALEDSSPGLESNYLGADFGYLRLETSGQFEPSATLRWWLFRQPAEPVLEERLVFWLRADLAE